MAEETDQFIGLMVQCKSKDMELSLMYSFLDVAARHYFHPLDAVANTFAGKTSEEGTDRLRQRLRAKQEILESLRLMERMEDAGQTEDLANGVVDRRYENTLAQLDQFKREVREQIADTIDPAARRKLEGLLNGL